MNGLSSEHNSLSDERTHGRQVPTFSTPLSRTERQASDEQRYEARSFRRPSGGLVLYLCNQPCFSCRTYEVVMTDESKRPKARAGSAINYA